MKGESLDVKVRKLVSPGVKERSKKGPGVFIRRETPVVEGARVESKGPSQSSQGSPHSDGRIDVPPRRAGEESEESSEAPKFLPTRNCPSCETGMNAPGTRHTAQCKRGFAEFQEAMQKQRRVELEGVGSEQSSPVTPVPAALAESPQPMEVGTEVPPVPHFTAGTSAEYRQRFKRPAETETEDLEREIQESSAAMVGTVGDENFDWFWVETGEPVLISSMFVLEGAASFCPATAPKMFSGNVESIKYEPHKQHEYVKMTLGKSEVLVWKPDSIVDDQTLQYLDPDLGFLGMQEEIHNLEGCKTGTLVGEAQVKDLKRGHPNTRVIQSRWVCAYKGETRVRCRIVAKDFNRGSSAKSLGFSSPTPSIESVHLVLTIACKRGYRLRSLDISHAFMHSPIRGGTKIVLKLPLSVSLISGEPGFMILDKALNGLRDASLCWLELLSDTVESVGLWN